jgi:hypothetical protein
MTFSIIRQKIDQKKFESFVLTVTPDLAQYILTHHNISNNRKISLNKARLYADCMNQGVWMIGDSLKFDIEGMLCDGQHRLKAVTIYGASVDFLVTVGYEPRSAQVLDRGKARSLPDVAALRGDDWIKPIHLSTFNSMFYTGKCDSRKSSLLSDDYRIQCLNDLKEGILFASQKLGGTRAIRCSAFRGVIARAYYADKFIERGLLLNFLLFFYGYDPKESPELFDQDFLTYSSAIIIRLREFYLANNWSRYGTLEGRGQLETKAFLVQNVLKNYLEQTNVRQLRLSEEILFPSKLIDSI